MHTLLTLQVAIVITTSASAQSAIDRYLTGPVTFTDVATAADQVDRPCDLDFKPGTNELWVPNYGSSNGGSIVIVHQAGMNGQTSEYRKDTHSSHFMVFPSAIAFSDIGEWACANEILNTAGGNSTFMGPALWSGDPNIFATVFQNDWVNGAPLGSHLDMLHQSPMAMGIAWESAKAYWIMDGHNGNLCRYDFVQDHGPGYEDHSAGRIDRYTDVTVTRVPNVPSHMVIDHATGWLYFIDGGDRSIKRLNITTGTVTGNLTVPSTASEPLNAYRHVEGATVETVDTWVTGQPCGIDIAEGRLLVSDHGDGQIKVYDVTASTPVYLGAIATGHPGIMGLKVGHDGRIWFVDNDLDKVVRADAPALNDDASISAIVSPVTINAQPAYFSTAFDVCATTMAPVVRLSNTGANTLTSAMVHVQLDGGTATDMPWTGTLDPGATTDVTLSSVQLPPGAHALKAWVSAPNGGSDTNPMNDGLEGSFRVKASTETAPFNEGFEAATFPTDGWDYVHFNPNCKMDRVTNASGMGASSACLKMDNYSGQEDITGQKDYLFLPAMDLSGAPTGTELGFNVAYARYNTSSDKLRVKASVDCGATWTTLYEKQGAALATAPATTASFTPTAAQWRLEQVDLSTVLGGSDVLLMFEAESNWGNNVYIDDVQMGTTVGVDELSTPSWSLYPNPTSGRFRITPSTAVVGPVEMQVLSAAGNLMAQRSLLSVSTTGEEIDLIGLAQGCYIVRFTDRQQHSSYARIIIQ